MKANIAKELVRAGLKTAGQLSDPDYNKKNLGQLVFKVQDVIPMTEYTATVIYKKNDGKKFAVFFWWSLTRNQWFYIPPVDSHIHGLALFAKYKEQVEKENFQYNFDEGLNLFEMEFKEFDHRYPKE
jgi:hypothetical protein